MSEGHQHHERTSSPEITSHAQGASIIQVEASKLLPWLMFCAVLSGLAVGLAILAIVLGQQSERESRLAQYDLQILRAKVEAIGIKTGDH